MRRGSHLWTCCTLTNPLDVARTWQLDFYIDVYSRPIRHGFLRLRAASCGRGWVWVVKFTGRGTARRGTARHDATRRDTARCGVARRDAGNSFSFPPFYLFIFSLSPLSLPFSSSFFFQLRVLAFLPLLLSTVHICFWGVVPVIEDRVWILFGFYCDAVSNDAKRYRSGEKWTFFGFFCSRSISVSQALTL